MKFGKLDDISDVDFSLPPINDRTLDLLGRQPARRFQAYVGLPRWASKDWVGQLFPRGTKQNEYLYYYSRSFNTIELNTTHYRIPQPDQIQKWAQQVPDTFVFCPKIPQVISHYRKMIHSESEMEQFTDSIRVFGDRMGCAFVQMHESFGPALMANLETFLECWPEDLPIAFEFRNAEWFDTQQLFAPVLGLLREYKAATVITDVSGRRDVLHTDLTNKTAMIRLVGNALDKTDYERADAWVDRLKLWVNNGLEKLYLFPHEPGDVEAAKMGTYLVEQLNLKLKQELRIPGIPDTSSSGQISLFG